MFPKITLTEAVSLSVEEHPPNPCCTLLVKEEAENGLKWEEYY